MGGVRGRADASAGAGGRSTNRIARGLGAQVRGVLDVITDVSAGARVERAARLKVRAGARERERGKRLTSGSPVTHSGPAVSADRASNFPHMLTSAPLRRIYLGGQ